MANTLKKLGELIYVPGTPSTPYRPAYCLEESISSTDAVRRVGRHSSTSGDFSEEQQTWGAAWPTQTPTLGDSVSIADADIQEYSVGGTTSGTSLSRYQDKNIKCYPEIQGQPGTKARLEREDRVGWDGAARSIDSIDADGYVSFYISGKPNGIVAGFARTNTGPAITDITHGVYAHGSFLEIIESGTPVVVTGVSPATKPLIVVKRESGYVDYFVGEWHYRSETRSGGAAFLDASLYTTSDQVEDPVISSDLSTFSADGTGGADISLPALNVFSGEGSGSSSEVSLAALRFEITASLTGMNRADTSLPALAVFSGEGVGTSGILALPALTIDASQGALIPVVGGVDGVLPPLYGAAHGMTGTVGGVDRALPALAALVSDRVYGGSSLTLAPMYTYSDDGPPDGTYGLMQYMYAVDFAVIQPTLFASITENLELEEADAVVVLSFVGSVFEGLQLSETITLTQMLQAIAEERLVVNSSTRQGTLEAIQYAVNIATGALTTYQGFDFQGFVKVGETAYGYRTDGLYKVRPGDDDGAGINAMVDFGVIPITRDEDAPAMAKTHLHDAFLGLDSDGTSYMKLIADGGMERVYRVVDRGDASRSRFGKGITAREWRVKLELIGATDATLDGIEYLAAVSTRRWTR